MSPQAEFQKFGQDVYRTFRGRSFDDITGADGQTYLQEVADWLNDYLDELELATDPAGRPVDWKFMLTPNYAFPAAISEGDSSVSIPTTILNLVTSGQRYVQIKQGDVVVSNWEVLSPGQINDYSYSIFQDSVAQVGSTLVFSRAFRDYEDGGSLYGDVTVKLPRIVYSVAASGTFTPTNVKVLTQVVPRALLVLGTAKNVTLPDIVQGGLTPSFVQKYQNDVLQPAIARNNISIRANQSLYDDFGYIRGLY